MAIEHHAAANERTEKDVEKVLAVLTIAQHQFSGAGCRAVIVEIDRPRTDRCDFGANIGLPPGGKNIGRCAQLGLPVPQLEGRGDAEAGDALALCLAQSGSELVNATAGQVQHDLWRRIGVRLVDAAPHGTRKIHQYDIGTASADLEPEEEGTAWIECIGNQGLTHLATQGIEAKQNTITFQRVYDGGNGLR